MTQMSHPARMATAPMAPHHGLHLPPWLHGIRVGVRFARAYAAFLRRGATSPEGYADMRRLYRMTNGRWNDAVARLTGLAGGRYRFSTATGLLRET